MGRKRKIPIRRQQKVKWNELLERKIYLSNKTTAVDREKAVNGKAKHEQYKNCPTCTAVQIIGDCRYIVHSYFVGDKDLDEVMNRLALESVLNEMETA